MNLYRIYGAVSPLFRRRRMERFVRETQPSAETTILDVGGSKPTWEYIEGSTGRITLLNILPPPESERADTRFEFVHGDATALPYADQSFDVVFSNSVIEHVGNYEQQKAFAREAMRVGRAIWVQTPAREFFIEPHLIAPFIHWLPVRTRERLARRFTLWGIITKPAPAQVREFIAGIRLLNYDEMQALFPECRIIVERFLGLAKSYIAVRVAPAEASAFTGPAAPARSRAGDAR